FFFQAEDGIRDRNVTGVQTCALPICLRLPHVSRTLGQLVRAEMAHCVGGERRGKLYAASRVGLAVWGELSEARGDRLVAPMIRGSHFRNYHHWIAVHHGRAAADKTLIEA